MTISNKYLLISTVGGIVVGFVLGLFTPLNLWNIFASQTLTVEKDVGTQTSYTSHAKNFWFGEAYYSIGFTTNDEIQVIGIFGNSSFLETFEAIEGSKYIVFGAEISISEVQSSYIIVSVKPL